MRHVLIASLALACASSSPSQRAADAAPPQQASPPPAIEQKGIEVGDLDRKADPCTDFYEFANGTWRAQNPIPPSMQRWSRRWQAGDANKGRLRDILEDVSAKSWPSGTVEQLIGDYYASCMDQSRVDARGLEPLKRVLAELDAVDSQRALQAAILKLHDIGVFAPFGVTSQPDQHEPSRTIADVFASGLGMPDRDYYLKPEPRFVEAREKYKAHVAKMLQLAGMKPQDATAVFDFETRLAKASLDNVELRDPSATDHVVPFAKLSTWTPKFDWNAYFDRAHMQRADLNVDQPKFMEEVNRELADTPLAVWRTYLKWQLVASAAPSLAEPFVLEDFDFNQRILAGVTEMKPRWKRCAESTDELFGDALGRKYVERYFPPAAKERAQDLVKNVLAAMKDTIDGLDWMGPETKKKALEKLSTFRVKVGYPDRWKDYSAVHARRDAFWENVAAGRAWNVNDQRGLAGKPTDRERWGMTPPTSDASYNPLLNDITFPAGILQPPAFSLDATDAVNYGAIGVVIGHEVSHGFDDQGAQFDAQGRLQNWWTAADLDQFHKRGGCVVDQFDHYFIETGIHHNGKLVLGESIGDLGGAHIAHRAFQKALAQHPQPLPRDGFTQEQEFFIAWGQFRGDEIRPETQRLMVQGDPHPVAKYRVIGPLSNLAEFQQAFSCRPGSPMVRPPQDRCSIW